MTKEQFQKEIGYHVAVSLWKEMFAAGIIDNQDFAQIDKLYIDRYCPNFRSPAPLSSIKPKVKSLKSLESESSPE